MGFVSGGLNFEAHAEELLNQLTLAGLEVDFVIDEECASYKVARLGLAVPLAEIAKSMFPGHKHSKRGKTIKVFRASKGSNRVKKPAELSTPADEKHHTP